MCSSSHLFPLLPSLAFTWGVLRVLSMCAWTTCKHTCACNGVLLGLCIDAWMCAWVCVPFHMCRWKMFVIKVWHISPLTPAYVKLWSVSIAKLCYCGWYFIPCQGILLCGRTCGWRRVRIYQIRAPESVLTFIFLKRKHTKSPIGTN